MSFIVSYLYPPQSGLPFEVIGTIYNSSGQYVAGASVQIGSASTTSGSDGSYAINGFTAGSYPVTITLSGYTTLSSTLTMAASAQIVQNFTLTAVGTASSGTSLRVTSITTQYSPNGEALYFLDGVSFPVTFTATVNWGTHTPGTVQFITPNNGIFQANANGGNTASQAIDVGGAFGPGGQLQVQAVSSDGTSGVATVANFAVMSAAPLSSSSFEVLNDGGSFYYQSIQGMVFQLLNDSLPNGIEVDSSIPLFGGNPIDLGFTPTLNAKITGNHLDLFQVGVSASPDNGDDDNSDTEPDLGMADVDFGLSSSQLDIFANYNATLGQWQWGGSFEIAGDVNVSPPPVYLPVPIPVPVYASVDFDLSANTTLTLSSFNPLLWNGTLELDPSVTGTLGVGIDGCVE